MTLTTALCMIGSYVLGLFMHHKYQNKNPKRICTNCGEDDAQTFYETIQDGRDTQ